MTNDRFGNPDSAHYFDSDGDYIECSTGNPLGQIGQGPFSVSLWYNHAEPNNGTLCSFGKDLVGTFLGEEIFTIYTDPYFKLKAIVHDTHNEFTNTADAVVTIDPSPDTGAWHHLVTVVSEQNIQVFLDGVEVVNEEKTYNYNSGNWENNLFIGAAQYGANAVNFTHSSIDDVRIYNRALSENEVQILYLGFVDTDEDGIPDEEDGCPESDLNETIVIDGCDSGVENTLFGDGCTMSDLIDELPGNAENHGQFVSSVSHLTTDWKKEGLISGKEKGAIMKCAAKATIPNCNFVTVSGKILYDGPPKPGVLVRLVENENSTVLDTTRTDSDGNFSFTFKKIKGFQEYGVDVQPEEMENALTGWRGFRLFDENCENVLPDFDMHYVESFVSPPDGATFFADDINDSNPIVFQWPGRNDATSYSTAIESFDEVWGRYFFPETYISFNGTLNDGTKIVP